MIEDIHLSGLPGTVLHDVVVPARAPWLHHVAAGQTLRIVDLEGNQAVDFLLYAAKDDAERYSAQDTVAAQGNLFLRKGTVLRSNEGRPMMTIAATSVGRYDARGAPNNSKSAMTSGSGRSLAAAEMARIRLWRRPLTRNNVSASGARSGRPSSRRGAVAALRVGGGRST